MNSNIYRKESIKVPTNTEPEYPIGRGSCIGGKEENKGNEQKTPGKEERERENRIRKEERIEAEREEVGDEITELRKKGIDAETEERRVLEAISMNLEELEKQLTPNRNVNQKTKGIMRSTIELCNNLRRAMTYAKENTEQIQRELKTIYLQEKDRRELAEDIVKDLGMRNKGRMREVEKKDEETQTKKEEEKEFREQETQTKKEENEEMREKETKEHQMNKGVQRARDTSNAKRKDRTPESNLNKKSRQEDTEGEEEEEREGRGGQEEKGEGYTRREGIEEEETYKAREAEEKWDRVGKGGRVVRKEGDWGSRGGEGGPGREFTRIPGRNYRDRRKGEAITVIWKDDKTFAEVVKKMKESAGTECEGVKDIRMTRTGNVLIEFNNKANTADVYKRIKRELGEEFITRRMVPTKEIEIKGVDPTVTKEEVIEAVRYVAGKEVEVNCRILRTGPDGKQIAVLDCSEEVATMLVKRERIKVGWLYSRVYEVPKVIRCYACHNFGHMAIQCKENTQGREKCRRCGEYGHSFKVCEAPIRCCLCVKKGLGGNAIVHIAGSMRCRAYKEVAYRMSKNREQGTGR